MRVKEDAFTLIPQIYAVLLETGTNHLAIPEELNLFKIL